MKYLKTDKELTKTEIFSILQEKEFNLGGLGGLKLILRRLGDLGIDSTEFREDMLSRGMKEDLIEYIYFYHILDIQKRKKEGYIDYELSSCTIDPWDCNTNSKKTKKNRIFQKNIHLHSELLAEGNKELEFIQACDTIDISDIFLEGIDEMLQHIADFYAKNNQKEEAKRMMTYTFHNIYLDNNRCLKLIRNEGRREIDFSDTIDESRRIIEYFKKVHEIDLPEQYLYGIDYSCINIMSFTELKIKRYDDLPDVYNKENLSKLRAQSFVGRIESGSVHNILEKLKEYEDVMSINRGNDNSLFREVCIYNDEDSCHIKMKFNHEYVENSDKVLDIVELFR